MEKAVDVVAVGYVDQDSFTSSLIDFGEVLIKKIADGRLGIYCHYSLTEDQAAIIERRETAVDHWPMPEISKFDFNNRFQNLDNGSIILELKSIQQEIQIALFQLLNEQLREKNYELVFDN
jgi:hypothetical protein